LSAHRAVEIEGIGPVDVGGDDVTDALRPPAPKIGDDGLGAEG
jgi:hypothetical protein